MDHYESGRDREARGQSGLSQPNVRAVTTVPDLWQASRQLHIQARRDIYGWRDYCKRRLKIRPGIAAASTGSMALSTG